MHSCVQNNRCAFHKKGKYQILLIENLFRINFLICLPFNYLMKTIKTKNISCKYKALFSELFAENYSSVSTQPNNF